jgi:hypothetical protein
MTKDGMSLTGIESLPSGRGMAGWFRNIYIVNIDAPSGASRLTEREEFYNLDFTHLPRNFPTNYVIGEDFNCVTHQDDFPGTPTYSKALDTFIIRFGLIVTWNTSDSRPLYTHYTQHGATRIGRLYMSPSLRPLEQNAAIISAAFTDHHAALVRLRLHAPQAQWVQGHWKLNALLQQEDAVFDRFQRTWCMWRLKQGSYLDPLMWWDKCLKKAIRSFSIH